jgi:endonuclease/exonuclease/phosphatase family metal-dependent hydrolase
MLVVSWNLAAKAGLSRAGYVAKLDALKSANADILLLQEINAIPKVATQLAAGLEKIGLPHFLYTGRLGGDGEEKPKNYGCAIASRWPIRCHDAGWAKAAPWPQLLGRAEVDVDGVAVDVITAHIPNGSGNGWKKIDTFNVLAEALIRAPRTPRILAGDFNEPQLFLDDGTVVTWGQRMKDGKPVCEGLWRGGPAEDWDRGVRSVLDAEASHGLRDVRRSLGRRPEVTHETRGKPRYFDHILASDHFTVEDMGYHHAWRAPGVSDHAGIWARMKLGAG